MGHEYFVYILTNDKHSVLYIGVTNDLKRRVYEHKTSVEKDHFTAKYKVMMLMYYERFTLAEDAIRREKQLKKGSRQRKVDLINSFNPEWRDLFGDISEWW